MGFPAGKREFLVSKLGEERVAILEKQIEGFQEAALVAGLDSKGVKHGTAERKSWDIDAMLQPLLDAIEKIEKTAATVDPARKSKATDPAIQTWVKSLREDGTSAGRYTADLLSGRVVR